jgi:ATP-dependent exoDNAse (exonuclease V) alpha subunit
MTYARDKTFEREAVVDRRDLMKEALKRACGHASLSDVERAFDDRSKRGDLLRVEHVHQGSPSLQYTTPSMIANEQRNIEHMRQGQDRYEPLVGGRIRDESAHAAHLSSVQQEAVREILGNRDRIFALQGVAGSGKTTTLREVRTAAQRDGYKVQGLAPTSRAASQLQEAGISSMTLQRHLAQSPSQSAGRGHLFVVDESSLVSSKQTGELLDRLNSKDRVLLVGDNRQHQAVEAGRPFEQLQQAGMRTAKLDEIVRQRDPGLKQVVHDLSEGRVREGIAQLREQGRIHEIPDRGQRLSAIAREYTNGSARTLVISPDNHTRQDLNERIRHELKDRGLVDKRDHQ